VQLLEKAASSTPCEWYRFLLHRGQKLAVRATTRLASRWLRNSVGQPGDDVEAMLGHVNRIHAQDESVPASPAAAALPPESADFDFDMWLDSLCFGSPVNPSGSASSGAHGDGNTTASGFSLEGELWDYCVVSIDRPDDG
jgi:hypothetical protein